MIKNPKLFLKEEEEMRAAFLQSLTYPKSAVIMQALLSSKLILKMHFSDDDHPVALYKSVKRKDERNHIR